MDSYQDLGLSKKVFRQLKERYRKAKGILEVSIGNDPDTKTKKQEAIEILKSILDLIQKSVDKKKQHDPRLCAVTTVCNLNIAKTNATLKDDEDECNYGEDAERFYNEGDKALKILKNYPETILTAIYVSNELGFFWRMRKDHEKALKYLQDAIVMFKTFKESNFTGTLFSTGHLFGPVKEPQKISLERQNIFTHHYLSDLYRDMDLLAECTKHKFKELDRILELPNHDVIEWVGKVAKLSKLFMKQECFEQVNYCLSIAEKILDKHETTETRGNKACRNPFIEFFLDASKSKNARADICYYSAKSGLSLLSLSANRLGKKLKGKVMSEQNQLLKKLKFDKFTDIEIEEKIPTTYPSNMKDAEVVFSDVLDWLDELKSYTSCEFKTKRYVKCIVKMSEAHKLLSNFEKQEEKRTKLHMKRIDLLEDSKNKLHKKSEDYLKDIWLELGNAYSDILDIKLHQMITGKIDVSNVSSEINHFRNAAICNYQSFLESEKISDKEELTDISQILMVYKKVGMLYNKFVTYDVKIVIENMEKSLEAFEFVINYCDKNLLAKEAMSETLIVCNFYISLLPKKIKELKKDSKSYSLFTSLHFACQFFLQIDQIALKIL